MIAVRGIGLSGNTNSRTHTCVSSVYRNTEKVTGIGRVSRSMGRFPVESVGM